MAILFYTPAAAALLTAIKKEIDAKHIVTWSYDKDGDFTHAHTDWANKAWMRPTIESDKLRLNFLKSKTQTFDWAVYGVYQGRFIESVTTHFHESFTLAAATSKPTAEDIVS